MPRNGRFRTARPMGPPVPVELMKAALAVAVVLATACASLPEEMERVHSAAFSAPETTFLGRYFASGMAAHFGESACVVLDTGEQALLARLAIIEVAERSIDTQYFIWHGDDCGRLLMGALLRAAERGVRVRLLIDDAHAQGQDLAWGAIASQPNIDVRIFNPFGGRGGGMGRTFEMARDMRRLGAAFFSLLPLKERI